MKFALIAPAAAIAATLCVATISDAEPRSQDAQASAAAQKRGPRGPRGVPGPRGPQGPTGLKGDNGASGPQGATGPTGEPGPAGLTGTTGLKGEQGEKGASGDKGQTGATGPKGDRGERGPSDGYFHIRTGSPFVTAKAPDRTIIATLPALPAGRYLITARATVANSSGAGDAVRCEVIAGPSAEISPISTVTVGTAGGFALVADLSVAVYTIKPTQFDAQFACYHEQDTQHPRMEAIVMTAIEVSDLHVSGS